MCKKCHTLAVLPLCKSIPNGVVKFPNYSATLKRASYNEILIHCANNCDIQKEEKSVSVVKIIENFFDSNIVQPFF